MMKRGHAANETHPAHGGASGWRSPAFAASAVGESPHAQRVSCRGEHRILRADAWRERRHEAQRGRRMRRLRRRTRACCGANSIATAGAGSSSRMPGMGARLSPLYCAAAAAVRAQAGWRSRLSAACVPRRERDLRAARVRECAGGTNLQQLHHVGPLRPQRAGREARRQRVARRLRGTPFASARAANAARRVPHLRRPCQRPHGEAGGVRRDAALRRRGHGAQRCRLKANTAAVAARRRRARLAAHGVGHNAGAIEARSARRFVATWQRAVGSENGASELLRLAQP